MSARRILVALHALAAGRRQLHQHGVVALGATLGEQFRKRLQPNVDALGVVEPVDAEQDLRADCPARRGSRAPGCRMLRSRALLVEGGGVDRDGERPHLDGAEPDLNLTQPGPDTHRGARRVRADEPAWTG